MERPKNDGEEQVSIRFIIRRDVNDDYHHWSLRDGLCKNVESHDFSGPYWTDDCDGECDTFRSFHSAINKAQAAT